MISQDLTPFIEYSFGLDELKDDLFSKWGLWIGVTSYQGIELRAGHITSHMKLPLLFSHIVMPKP
jgi:hypothetical protein